jgi:hypothetical protein
VIFLGPHGVDVILKMCHGEKSIRMGCFVENKTRKTRDGLNKLQYRTSLYIYCTHGEGGQI